MMQLTSPVDHPARNGEALPASRIPLGHIDWDGSTPSNDRVMMRSPLANRHRITRDQYVRIDDPLRSRTGFLGRIISGPFFFHSGPTSTGSYAPSDDGPDADIDVVCEIELHGELVDGRPRSSTSRPLSQAVVHELTTEEVAGMLGFSGDMILGEISGQAGIRFRLQSKNKGVLPRNLGIFGTVGSGKSNTSQVLIEEASANGWAVVVVDVESEYVDMDAVSEEHSLFADLARFDKQPAGLPDFHVHYPASCTSERERSQPFALRLADFESGVIAEILQTSVAERNALLDCIENLQTRARTKLLTREADDLEPLLDPSPQAKLAFTLRTLRDRAAERSSRSTEFFDYTGLSTKLMWLMQSGAFDLPNMRSLDLQEMLKPGRVSIIDVSMANDVVKNLVTADLLRKSFAYKVAHEDAPRTLLVIEEAHSFISREKAQTMQATVQMLRNVSRRGRKRWLALAFISQQPGHLPPEIFELCNTRIVHTLRSMHNLEVLMTTSGDVGREMWDRCPLLGAGEAIVTSPQLKRPVVVTIRPASSQRRHVR